jgi:phosphonate transport system substrate-binding protein
MGEEADPKQFFSQVFIAGGYRQAWEALRQGYVDVSVIAGDVSETLYNEVLQSTRIIEKQGPIPSHAVVFSKELKEPLRTQFVNAFLELGRPEYRDLMKKLVSAIFVEFKTTSTEEHIAGLSSALEKTGFKFTERI